MNFLKLVSAVLFLSFSATIARAQGVWKWGRGATGVNPTEGYHCTTDGAGSVYGSGENEGTGYFDVDSIVGKGVFVVKYDSSGNFRWVINAATAYVPTSLGIGSDKYGNEYIFGMYELRVIFGPDTVTGPTYTDLYYFVAKIDSAGNVKWTKTVGNAIAATAEEGSHIAVDPQGNLYITCSFKNNPVIGPYTLTNSSTTGTSDLLVAKFDSSGTVIWAKSFGGSIYELASGIAISPQHEVYVVGQSNSPSISFGSSVITDTGSVHGNYTVFLLKLDAAGNPIWARGIDGSNTITGVAVSRNQNVFVTGSYHNTTITLGATTLPFAPFSGNCYGYLAKYDSFGTVSWAKAMTGNYVQPYIPVIDSCGNVWVNGNFGNGVCTDVIDGHTMVSPTGSDDPLFLACWTDAGAWLQSGVLASGGDDRCGMAIDYRGNLYLDGDYRSTTITFGSAGSLTLPYLHECNFVAKYTPNQGCPAGTLSQTDPEQYADFNIYPNPASLSCTITCPGIVSQNATAALFDITGRLVHIYSLIGNTTTLSVADLQPGLYQCRIDTGNGLTASRKLVVVR